MSLISHRLFPIGLALFTALLAACSSPPERSLGAAVAPLYTVPATYQDHRDQQQALVIDGQTLAYTDHGDGPALVLLHGVPTSSWMYRKLIPELQAEFRVITVDFLGYGSSDKPNGDVVYTDVAQADRVTALMDHLGISEYALLVHDMGGLVGWELMRSHPNAVSHAVILNTIVGDDGFNQPNMEAGAMTRTLMSAYSSDLTSEAVLLKTFNDLGLTGEHKLTEAECAGYVVPMREGADDALYTFFVHINDDLFARLDANWAALKSWPGDALVLWGGRDETLTTGQIPMIQSALSVPNDQIHIYPENAHFLAEEIPDEIADQVTKFLQSSP
ncbi:MAG: alpha/beta fold hydrolase [Pseudomonadota bacterium]